MTTAGLMAVILAAGKGTRMHSKHPKVLHPVAGRSMLGHVMALSETVKCDRTVVVVGSDMQLVSDEVRTLNESADIFVQKEQLGTADAVLAAKEAFSNHNGDVVVLYADTPLITPETIQRLTAALNDYTHVAVLGFEAKDPTGYGRLLTTEMGELTAVREDKDCTDDEQKIRLCNSGVMAFRVPDLTVLLQGIGNDNAKGEYYLTDAVELIKSSGGKAGVVICDEDEVLGVNNRCQLAEAEALWQKKRRRQVMMDGTTLIAPDTVWFSFDTRLGRDVVVEPNVFFGPGVDVGDDVIIKANCHIEQTQIGAGARIGPFARLRPGAKLGENTFVGNFVEIKNTTLGTGAKASHLSYLGDGSVGEGANIGAGTIFCNYDGFNKAKTDIGAGAFIGSNSALVAPVKIGVGAYVGSGSVITKNVPEDSLALERSEQKEHTGWAKKFRALMQRQKDRMK